MHNLLWLWWQNYFPSSAWSKTRQMSGAGRTSASGCAASITASTRDLASLSLTALWWRRDGRMDGKTEDVIDGNSFAWLLRCFFIKLWIKVSFFLLIDNFQKIWDFMGIFSVRLKVDFYPKRQQWKYISETKSVLKKFNIGATMFIW